ncbi:MAG: PDZ domain-containing protein [Limisphaerales bacterium]
MKRLVVLIVLCVGWFGGVGFAAETGGVGIAIGKEGDATLILTIIPDTPAAASNALKKNDRIIAIAQGDAAPVETSGKGVAQVVQMIRGPIGSAVRLTIIPAGADVSQARVISLVRGELEFTRAKRAAERTKIGGPAPEITGVDMGGKQFKLSDYRGQVVLIDFWGDW